MLAHATTPGHHDITRRTRRAGASATFLDQPRRGADMSARIPYRHILRLMVTMTLACTTLQAVAQGRGALEADAKRAYGSLVASVPAAKALGGKAVAVLVFPKITKAGLVVGGQTGDGVLLKGGKPAGYYNTSGASYGLQAGAQQFGYAMFFMNENAVKALSDAKGFEVGVGPSVVMVDEGMAKQTTTTTMKDDVYAFVFGQKGLMAGLGLQGNKITKLD
jgi:lipid-binding SYLF domain-containing protein